MTKRRSVAESTGQPYLPPPALEDFRAALEQAEPRPQDIDGSVSKKNYAEKLSNKIAVLIGNRLRARGQFPGILPNPDGTGRESTIASGAHKKGKKIDVRYGTIDTGLELLVSIKTLSFRDAKTHPKTGARVLGRYTKNMVRNDHELRAEAMDVHERQPFAVLIAMLFMPFSACDDGENDKSSFAHAIEVFRRRGGREKPVDAHESFERMFIGLYELEGEGRGNVGFFDVLDSPPRRGRPHRSETRPNGSRSGLLNLEQTIDEIVKTYGIRNGRYIQWADEDGTNPPELAPLLPDADDGDDEA